MMRGLLAFVSGAIFAAGLCLSGMTRPERVTAFLDVGGAWDPSLAFVMASAIAVAAVAFRVAVRLRAPMLGGRFDLPDTRRPITRRLLVGAAIFGLGWGLSGLCPGPALVSLASGQVGTLVFSAAMVTGMLFEGALARRREAAPSPSPPPEAGGVIAP